MEEKKEGMKRGREKEAPISQDQQEECELNIPFQALRSKRKRKTKKNIFQIPGSGKEGRGNFCPPPPPSFLFCLGCLFPPSTSYLCKSYAGGAKGSICWRKGWETAHSFPSLGGGKWKMGEELSWSTSHSETGNRKKLKPGDPCLVFAGGSPRQSIYFTV